MSAQKLYKISEFSGNLYGPDKIRHKIKNLCIKTDENLEYFIMSAKSLIEEELSQAGEASPISPLVLQLDKYRIMSDTDVPPEEFFTAPKHPRAKEFLSRFIAG